MLAFAYTFGTLASKADSESGGFVRQLPHLLVKPPLGGWLAQSQKRFYSGIVHLTHVLGSSHTEKLGVAHVETVCAKARIIFRPIVVDDVGIDGFIELVENGSATGIIAGVQIKSGEAFTDDEGQYFKLISDQAHFGYWARCSFPVIGVIYSPKYEKAVWMNLTDLSTDKRIIEGPYSITVEYTNETAFTPSNLISQIAPTIQNHAHQRRTLWQIQELTKPKHQKATLSTPSLETSNDKDEAWKELTALFFAENSDNDVITDSGYRLSWHFPSVSENLQRAFIEQLTTISDFQLARIIEVVDDLLESSNETVAELIADLLSYEPNMCKRIENLLKEHKIPSKSKEAAIQIIETINGKFNENLRNELGD